MKISEAWLREFVTPPGGTGELVRRLTMAGLKIESVEPVAGAFNGVVVATVRAVKAHPDAAKLTVCRVWDGAAEHQVVCGAPNVACGIASRVRATRRRAARWDADRAIDAARRGIERNVVQRRRTRHRRRR